MELTFATQSTRDLSERCALAEEILLNGKHAAYMWYSFKDNKWTHNVYAGLEAPGNFNTRAEALNNACARLTHKFERSILQMAA